MQKLSSMELRRIELRAFRLQSEHSTTELQPLVKLPNFFFIFYFHFYFLHWTHYIAFELLRIELRSSHMRSEHSSSELQPLIFSIVFDYTDLERMLEQRVFNEEKDFLLKFF